MADFAHDHRYRDGNGWRIVLLRGRLRILRFVDGKSFFVSDPEEAALYITQVIASLRELREKISSTGRGSGSER